MANFVWTGILYICTLGIVYVCYRAFMHDRRVERESGTREMIDRAYVRSPVKSHAMEAKEKAANNQIPGAKAQTPPWAARARRA
jgi:hypothetical protein